MGELSSAERLKNPYCQEVGRIIPPKHKIILPGFGRVDASMIFSKLEPGMCCQQQILMVQDEDEKIYFHSKGSVCLEFLT